MRASSYAIIPIEDRSSEMEVHDPHFKPFEWPRGSPRPSTPTAIRDVIEWLVRHEAAYESGSEPERDSGWTELPKQGEFVPFTQALGTWLFAQLQRDTQDALLSAVESGDPTRIVFYERGEPQGEGFPWEYLAVPNRDSHVFLATDARFSVVRARQAPRGREVLVAPSEPLFVVPFGVQPVSADTGVAHLPLIADLREQLRPIPESHRARATVKPDMDGNELSVADIEAGLRSNKGASILHLFAHGSPGGGVVLATCDGGGNAVSGAKLGRALAEARQLRLVVLSVCSSGRATLRKGLHSRFVDDLSDATRIPWIVACGAPLSSQDAQDLGRSLYSRLWAGDSIEKSVVFGRRMLMKRRSWAFGSIICTTYAGDAAGMRFHGGCAAIQRVAKPPPKQSPGRKLSEDSIKEMTWMCQAGNLLREPDVAVKAVCICAGYLVDKEVNPDLGIRWAKWIVGTINPLMDQRFEERIGEARAHGVLCMCHLVLHQVALATPHAIEALKAYADDPPESALDDGFIEMCIRLVEKGIAKLEGTPGWGLRIQITEE